MHSKNTYRFIAFSFLLCIGLLLKQTAHAIFKLDVPYTMQAPYSQWGVQPWEDACEEAATIMVDRYYREFRTTLLPKALASNLILHTVNLEQLLFGFNKDTNAEQMVAIINNYFPWEAKVTHDPSIELIKQEIDAGHPVIIPFYGKAVKNPYFRDGGPEYHTAVIKGYDEEKQEFIVNDPGNGYGLDYRYSYATLMDAMHDFLPQNNTKFGQKVAIFTRPELWDSWSIDADSDGLSKSEELRYGTLLWIRDTDGDGYTDGDEVSYGYSPILNELVLTNGSLIKTKDEPKVYLLEAGKKRLIPDEKVFLSQGWEWKDVKIVGRSFLRALDEGDKVR